jgi:uncharacterized membrane protein
MSPKVRSFLEAFEKHLRNLPSTEKADILKEIESHILLGLEHGQTESEILQRLGDPKVLATGYTGEYFLQQKSKSPKLFFKKLLFFASLGFFSPIVVTFLGGVSFAFGVATIALAIATILSAVGIDSIAGVSIGAHFGPSYQITGWAAIPIFIITMIITGLIAKSCWTALRKYFASISSRYRNLVPKKEFHA